MGTTARIFDAPLMSQDSQTSTAPNLLSHTSNNCIIRNNHKEMKKIQR